MARTTSTYQLHVPQHVTFQSQDGGWTFHGPLGSINVDIAHMDPHGCIAWKYTHNTLTITGITPALVGLWRGRLASIMHGITRGHSVMLYLRGIGYRAHVVDTCLYLKVGTSHDIMYRLPSGIRVYTPDPTCIVLFGVDRGQLTQIAASLTHLRPPSAYQSKGIYYAHGVHYRRKTGKRK